MHDTSEMSCHSIPRMAPPPCIPQPLSDYEYGYYISMWDDVRSESSAHPQGPLQAYEIDPILDNTVQNKVRKCTSDYETAASSFEARDFPKRAEA
jgi:hypothetical protein